MTAKTWKEKRESIQIKRAIQQINEHMDTLGWKVQCEELDKTIGRLTPAQIVESNFIHADLTPYLSAFHVSWLFDVCWAYLDGNPYPDDAPPKNYDRNKPLNVASLWAPQDRSIK